MKRIVLMLSVTLLGLLPASAAYAAEGAHPISRKAAFWYLGVFPIGQPTVIVGALALAVVTVLVMKVKYRHLIHKTDRDAPNEELI